MEGVVDIMTQVYIKRSTKSDRDQLTHLISAIAQGFSLVLLFSVFSFFSFLFFSFLFFLFHLLYPFIFNFIFNLLEGTMSLEDLIVRFEHLELLDAALLRSVNQLSFSLFSLSFFSLLPHHHHHQ